MRLSPTLFPTGREKFCCSPSLKGNRGGKLLGDAKLLSSDEFGAWNVLGGITVGAPTKPKGGNNAGEPINVDGMPLTGITGLG